MNSWYFVGLGRGVRRGFAKLSRRVLDVGHDYTFVVHSAVFIVLFFANAKFDDEYNDGDDANGEDGPM